MQQKPGPRRPHCEPCGTGVVGAQGTLAGDRLTQLGSCPTRREQEASLRGPHGGSPSELSGLSLAVPWEEGPRGWERPAGGAEEGPPFCNGWGSLTALQVHRERSVEGRRMEGRRQGCPSLVLAGVLQQKHSFREPPGPLPTSILVRIRSLVLCVTRKPVLRPEGAPGPRREDSGLLRGFGGSRREPQLRLRRARTHVQRHR